MVPRAGLSALRRRPTLFIEWICSSKQIQESIQIQVQGDSIILFMVPRAGLEPAHLKGKGFWDPRVYHSTIWAN